MGLMWGGPMRGRPARIATPNFFGIAPVFSIDVFLTTIIAK